MAKPKQKTRAMKSKSAPKLVTDPIRMIAKSLMDITDLLEIMVRRNTPQPRTQTDPSFMSGRWKRRDGTGIQQDATAPTADGKPGTRTSKDYPNLERDAPTGEEIDNN